MTSSLLFASATVGFALGTVFVERVMKFFGRFYLSEGEPSYLPAIPKFRYFTSLFTSSDARSTRTGHSPAQARLLTLVFSSVLHACFFVIMGTARNYGELLLAYATAAFARAFLIENNRGLYVSLTPKKPLGVLLAAWSKYCTRVGSFVSPFVCQSLVAKGVHWSHFYLGSLVLSGINTSLIVYSFRPTAREVSNDRKLALEAAGALEALHTTGFGVTATSNDKLELESSSGKTAAAPPNTLARALCMPYLIAFALFSWLYVGGETTFQGFIVTYLLGRRYSDPQTTGYVTSGFWGGMTVGRLLWDFCASSLSYTRRKYLLQGCIPAWHSVVAFLMHLTIWLINSVIENGIAAAVVGSVFGPIYPAMLGFANEVLPSDVHMVSMTILCAAASAGSALFPFIYGLLANVYGVQVFSFLTLSQAAAISALWILFPSSPPSRVSGNA
ncbi:hypothetical protein HYDPIDRAFT_81703 [Hydnomerulius pinastri MD-312]|nr:hypothetical protein HYDPIDRAFT_81703 [Hydnomerulius pinastri MD-312]